MYMLKNPFVFICIECGGNVKDDITSPEVKCGNKAIWKMCTSITDYISHDEWWTLGPKSGSFQSLSMPQFLFQKARSHIIL